MNYKAFVKFFTERQTTVNFNPVNFLIRIPPLYQSFFARFLVVKDQLLGTVTTILVTLGLIVLWWRNLRSKQISWQFLIVIVWVVIGILGIAAYKLTVFDHYFGFVNPAAFILFGLVLSQVWQSNTLGKVVTAIAILGLIILNIIQTPIRNPGAKQLERTQKIAHIVIAQTGGQPYNFALIAKNNYDAAYQYYLDLFSAKPAQVDFFQTDQLFVVCEDEICNPIGHPKSEIARFGFAKIERRWDISGVRMFKLTKNPKGVPQTEILPEEKILL